MNVLQYLVPRLRSLHLLVRICSVSIPMKLSGFDNAANGRMEREHRKRWKTWFVVDSHLSSTREATQVTTDRLPVKIAVIITGWGFIGGIQLT